MTRDRVVATSVVAWDRRLICRRDRLEQELKRERNPSVASCLAVVAGGLLALTNPAVAETYVLPSSAFRSGSNGAEYRTDVRILNQGSSAVTVNALFYDQVTSTTVLTNPFRIEARNQAAFDNILQSVFGKTLAQGAYGPIRFESTGPILVAASVNNVNTCGNGAVSGQWLSGLLTSGALKAGVIGQLAVSASSTAGYRTNLVFMNPGSTAARATVTVRRGGGAILATGTVGPLPANGFAQVGLDSFAGVAGTTDTNLWLEFTSDQAVLAYATIIHNVSGDPLAVVASGDPPPAPALAEITFTLPGGVPLVMVKIPAGTFQMGSPTTEWERYDDETLHQVTLTQAYYLGKYEVTQAQWQAVMGANPSYFSWCGSNCPVETVSWNDIRGANGFIEKLNQLLGTTKFRLPTEAEWERAARAGTQTRFSFGDALDTFGYCGTNAAADPFVWWCGNAERQTRAVGTKAANGYGLYDMHGNVFEWVEDWLGIYSSTAQTDPAGPTTGSARVCRGGSWQTILAHARSAGSRGYGPPTYRYGGIGFRLSRSQ